MMKIIGFITSVGNVLKNDTIYSDIDEHKTSILRPICGECFQDWKKGCS